MASDPTEIHAETDAARAGSTPNVVRWILAISLLAVIVLLSIVWITGALMQGDIEKEASVSAQIAEQRNEADTSSATGENASRIEAPKASDTAPSGLATTKN
jgi:hypothetical protein